MAVSGIIFVLFVLMHMYGNLKMFAGQAAFNGYAEHLRELGEPYLGYGWALWILRVALVVALLIHIDAAARLWLRARRARATKYQAGRTALAQTYASRTMRWGGVILLLFIIFHILQFTTMTVELGKAASADNPYTRVVYSFQEWYVWLIYLIAMLALAMHIRHGVWSALATLGANKKRRQVMINMVAIAVAAVIFIGFMAPPTAILFGLIG